MKKIKNITVATDLSKNSRVAYKFAQALASALDSKLHLTHVYMQPTMPHSSPLLDYLSSPESLQKLTLTRVKRFARNPSVQCTVFAGADADTLIDISDDIEFLAVGAKGEKGLVDTILGSVSLKVSRNAFCPVLVVPEKSKFNGIKQILFTTSEGSLKTKHVERAIQFAKQLGAKLHFVHVSDDKKRFDISVVDALMSTYDVPYETANLEFISERGGIDIYREKNAIDLIITTTHHMGFWENIFHSSFTKALEWNTEVPILVLHDEDIVDKK